MRSRLGTRWPLAAAVVVALACTPSSPPAKPAPVTAAPAAAAPATAARSPTSPPSAAAPTPAAPVTPESLSVALPVLSQAFLPYFIARERGYYAEERIETDLQAVAPQLGVQGVVAGSYSFTGAVSQAAIAALTGAPTRVVLNTHSITWWLVANQASGVRTVADLKGKTLGIEGPGTLSSTFTRVLLRKNGLNPDGDVQFASLGPVPNWLQGAIGGAVDAAIAGDVDLLLVAQAQGLTDVAWYGQDVRGSLIGLGTSESLLRDKPDAVKRFLRASLRGLQSYRTNREDTIALGARLLDQPADFVGRAYDLGTSLLLPEPMLDPSVQQEFVDLAKETLNLDRPIPPGEVFDYNLTRQALAEQAARPAGAR